MEDRPSGKEIQGLKAHSSSTREEEFRRTTTAHEKGTGIRVIWRLIYGGLLQFCSKCDGVTTRLIIQGANGGGARCDIAK